MARQPWYRTTPLHLMDSDPRDEGDDLDAADPVEPDHYDPMEDGDDPALDFVYDPPSLNR